MRDDERARALVQAFGIDEEWLVAGIAAALASERAREREAWVAAARYYFGKNAPRTTEDVIKAMTDDAARIRARKP